MRVGGGWSGIAIIEQTALTTRACYRAGIISCAAETAGTPLAHINFRQPLFAVTANRFRFTDLTAFKASERYLEHSVVGTLGRISHKTDRFIFNIKEH